MAKRMPNLSDKNQVCVICEGDEEYDYLEKLKSLNVWSEKYEILPDNAKGNGNISARYQDRYQNGSYDIVLVFCDTEKKPYKQYDKIKEKINEFHGDEDMANEVIIYSNPCTMQIILSHWDDVHLKSPSKTVNAPLIEKLTGVANYKGRDAQRKKIMEQITFENYWYMRRRIDELGNMDTKTGSSNFGRFMKFFEKDNDQWIKDINCKLEQEL